MIVNGLIAIAYYYPLWKRALPLPNCMNGMGKICAQAGEASRI